MLKGNIDHKAVTLKATSDIAPYRVCVTGDEDGGVAQASAATGPLLYVSGRLGCDDGEQIDVYYQGFVDVEAGATITVGAELTSDADGKVVVAAPGSGANQYTIGNATSAAADGDIFTMFLNRQSVHGT